MKVRLEIIDEDGAESTSVEFGGKHWKRCILAFIDSLEDENRIDAEPSSINSSTITNPVPDNTQQTVMPHSQPFHQSREQMTMQQPVPPQYYQQLQQQPVFQPNNYYIPPTAAPYYFYGQPAQPNSSITQPPPHNQQAQPAVSEVVAAREQEARRPSARARTTTLRERINDSSLTINERLELFLKYEYPRVWFSSQDVQQQYERIYGPIKQSTVSTYLSRMFQKRLLERRGNRTQREYRYIADEVEPSYQDSRVSAPPQFHHHI
ncbi:hypothetical protein [Methanolobus halotolerans]|uniref:Uncharacterized protein n=1 Tax=Methanolobus halotolerans TaxID=2052935 RepID=A0A4E0Q767_9EURY|nr:hypothetical protein [Methanolobus halotolerans]TGC10643.1 hypothetical protein CUN85_03910 [Methanolobus halotolerans]